MWSTTRTIGSFSTERISCALQLTWEKYWEYSCEVVVMPNVFKSLSSKSTASMLGTTRITCSFLTESPQEFLCLLQLIREKYWEYEYEEVVTPNLFNFELWKRSGHAEHYKENMFLVDIEEQEFGLKPMNCPGVVPLGHAPFILPTG